MTSESDNLSINKRDVTTSVMKALVGLSPIGSGTISEILDVAIPGQRVDRIVHTVRCLQDRLDSMEASMDEVDGRLSSPEFLPVAEEVLEQASRAHEQQRRVRLAEALAKSLTKEELEVEESLVLLRVLRAVSETEIIWLKYFALRVREQKEFYKVHEDVLKPASPAIGGDLREVKRKALKDRYVENLESLGLLDRKSTGSARGVTHLGHMFLEFVDPDYSFYKR